MDTTRIVGGVGGEPRKLLIQNAWIVLLTGEHRGKRYAVSRRVLRLGSAQGNDVVLPDATTSRHHALIDATPLGFRIRDAGSTNGVIIEGVRIMEAILKPGQVASLGDCRLRLEVDHSAWEVPVDESTLEGLVGTSLAMRELFTRVRMEAARDDDVLILGETGTGKEAVARAFHRLSSRARGPYEVVDCTNLPRELIESELFGYVRGAFTEARSDREGAFARADGGVLFLDELGELPYELQGSLLRVIQEREFRPLGAPRIRRSDFRLIAATNRNLAALVNQGRFREDLYYRLGDITITIPPLRERPEDIPLLLHRFLTEALSGASAPERDSFPPVSEAALCTLRAHTWPGNVRELRRFARRLVSDHRHRPLSASDIESPARLSQPITTPGPDPHMLLDQALSGLPAGSVDRFQMGKRRVIDTYEREFVRHHLKLADGNRTRAAELAGVLRSVFHRLMQRHGIGRDGEAG